MRKEKVVPFKRFADYVLILIIFHVCLLFILVLRDYFDSSSLCFVFGILFGFLMCYIFVKKDIPIGRYKHKKTMSLKKKP